MSKVPAARVIYPERPPRLTRRGRVVLAGIAALVIGGISMIAASAAQASSHAGPAGQAGPAGRAGIVQVTVRPGQSLWTIAESNDPDADTRAVIDEIQQLNSMSGSVVLPGQVLWVPRG